MTEQGQSPSAGASKPRFLCNHHAHEDEEVPATNWSPWSGYLIPRCDKHALGNAPDVPRVGGLPVRGA